jgi:hypothetical protein
MSNIDFNRIPASYPSLCIPRAFSNITKDRVYRAFKDVDLGEIDHVDLIERTSEKGERYLRIFVHFRRWYNNRNAMTARDRVLDGKDIKIVYDDPSFWKVFKNNYDELPREHRDRDSRHARLIIDDDRRRPERRPYRDDDRRRPQDDRRVERRPRDDRRPTPRSPASSPPRQRPEPKVALPEPKVALPEPKVVLLEDGEIDEEEEVNEYMKKFAPPENPDDDLYAGL